MVKLKENAIEIPAKLTGVLFVLPKHLIKYRNGNEKKKKNETTINKRDHFNSNFKLILQRTKLAFDRIWENGKPETKKNQQLTFIFLRYGISGGGRHTKKN